MKKLLTQGWKLYCLFYLGLILAVSACDFSTHEYYIYSNHKEGTLGEIYFLWSDSSQCGMTINDSSFQYDGFKLYFPSDKSTVNSHCESYYDYVRDSTDSVIDSVELCANYFTINEFNPRIKSNELVLLYIFKRNSLVRIDNMFRKKNTRFHRLSDAAQTSLRKGFVKLQSKSNL